MTGDPSVGEASQHLVCGACADLRGDTVVDSGESEAPCCYCGETTRHIASRFVDDPEYLTCSHEETETP